ncbi:hypothetical protein FJT64_015584 [Amphibalanus amphitrite]|uniref:Peptidase aspartic putative domain-containing protein n=1 Tax=Amphibalanus amphitrite TaxID=1232801 RepID=A0A6A4XFA2_AMPAM|nr:hypothetical protein FJT64_015584 [Amphibalanus amphitrite]
MEKEDTWMDEMYDIFSTTKKAFFSFNNETMKNVKEETGTNGQNIKQPEIQKLKMPLFSGTQDDVMSFNDFLKMFDDLIGNNSAYNQSAKLMYLKSYLRGNALDTIKHLSTEEKNYTIARKFLTEEYLDTDVIVEEHIRKLHDLTPPPARDLPALRAFFNTARTSVYELKAFGYDALEDGTLGSKIVSFIICEKLPVNFKVKLSAILHTDYPSTRQLLENFNAVIKSLMKTTPAKQETKHTTDLSSKPKQLKTTEVAGSAKPAKSSLQRFQTSAEPIKKTPSHSTSKFKACKLCEGAHSMLKCSAYTSPRTRIQRLKDLELCTKCSGSHKLTDCKGQTSGLSYPCTLCGSKQHISAVCVVKPGETTPLQSGMRLICNSLQKGQTVLLPSMTVIMHNGERSELVRCMIDVGSQASYISEELAVKLGCPLEAPKTTYKVKTCIGVQEKNYRTATSDIIFTPTASAHHCFLVDPEMSLEYEIPGVTSLVQFLRAKGVRLADSFFSHSTNDVIGGFECLLGADIIGAIKPMRSVDLGTGTAFEVQDGLILFGSLEHLFSIESLGIRETDESVSARERRLVEEFSNEVELRDGKYFVRVPFYDSVTKVPGNHDMYRFRTILFGLNCSPFILSHIIQIHLSKYSTTMAATALKESLYVDNFIFSTSDEGKLLDIYRDATQIMKEGGFNLRSWMSNFSPLVDIMMSDNMVNEHGAVTEKVLGYFNVADMLTRGLSAKEFHKKLAVWCHGPDWLGDHPEQWPKSPLHCLSEEGKVMVELQQHHQQVEINTEAQTPATQTIFSIKDFSSLRRLHGVTARVFHFVNVLKHREADAKEQATHYWLKVMQENAFTEEISYLQDKQENKLVNSASVPKLVKELNVFIDNEIDDIEPLTPNKILKLHTNPRLQLVDSSHATDPLWVSTPQDVHQQLNKTLHEQQHLQEHYKNMWYRY